MVQSLEVVCIGLSIWLVLRQAYWWQVKEYRWDRWWTFVRYNQGWKELMPEKLRRPKITARVMVMGGVWLVLGLVINTWWGWLVAAYLGPAAGVLLTAPINTLARTLLMKLAARRLSLIKPKVIGITGSFGKTNSKELLAFVLEKKFKVIKTQKNENSEIGIARRILAAVKPGIEVVVIEIGAYRRGEIARVCRMAPPDVVWITGVGNQHVGLFGSRENLKRAKFELVVGMKSGGTAVMNAAAGGEDLVKWAERLKIKTVTYAVPGRAGNETGAEIVAKVLGLAQKDIQAALLEFKEQFPWPKTWQTAGGITVIDEAYNANQSGFTEVVKYVEKQFLGRKYLVTPGIIELGTETETVHREMGKLVEKWDGVWVTNKTIAKFMSRAGEENMDKLLAVMRSTLKKGDVLLIVSRIPSKLMEGIKQL